MIETGGPGDPIPRPYERPELQPDRQATLQTVRDLDSLKMDIDSSLTPETVNQMTFDQIVTTEDPTATPEAIFTSSYIKSKALGNQLYRSQLENVDDPLQAELERHLSQEDMVTVFAYFVDRVAADINTTDLSDQTSPRINWLQRWKQHFEEDPESLEQLKLINRKNQGREIICDQIRAIEQGQNLTDAVVEIEDAVVTHQFSPDDIDTDPLMKRVYDLYIQQGRDPQVIVNEVKHAVRHQYNAAKERSETLPLWLQAWEADADFQRFLHPPNTSDESWMDELGWGDDTSATDSQPVNSTNASETDQTEDINAVTTPAPPTPPQPASPPPQPAPEVNPLAAEAQFSPEIQEKRRELLDLFAQIEREKKAIAPEGATEEEIKMINFAKLARVRAGNGPIEDFHLQWYELVDQLAEGLLKAQANPNSDTLFANLNRFLPQADFAIVCRRFEYLKAKIGESEDPVWEAAWQNWLNRTNLNLERIMAEGVVRDANKNLALKIQKLNRGDTSDSPTGADFYSARFLPGDMTKSLPKRLSELVGTQQFNHYLRELYVQLNRTDPTILSQADRDWYQLWMDDPGFKSWKDTLTSPRPPAPPVLASPDNIRDSIPAEHLSIYEHLKKIDRLKQDLAGRLGVDKDSITFNQIVENDSANSTLEKKILAHNALIEDLVEQLLDTKIAPPGQNIEIYQQLQSDLLPVDFRGVVQRLIYRKKNAPRSTLPEDQAVENAWDNFFARPDNFNQTLIIGVYNDAIRDIAQQIDQLANGQLIDNQAVENIVNNLIAARVNPSNPILERFLNVMPPEAARSIFGKFYQQIDDVPETPDNSDWINGWKQDQDYLNWKKHQSDPASPETFKEKAVRSMSELLNKGASKLGPIFVKAVEKIKNNTKEVIIKDLLIGNGTDFVVGLISGALIRAIVTSSAGSGAGMAVGAVVGGYKAFRRANQKYEKALKARADAGDAAAKTEWGNFRRQMDKKENFLKKELITKRKEAWKRFKNMSGKERTGLIGYTMIGGFFGGLGGTIGFQYADSLMGETPSVIETAIDSAKDAIEQYIDENFRLHITVDK